MIEEIIFIIREDGIAMIVAILVIFVSFEISLSVEFVVLFFPESLIIHVSLFKAVPPLQVQPDSTILQSPLQPSPSMLLPSSQASPPIFWPSPQCSTHVVGRIGSSTI